MANKLRNALQGLQLSSVEIKELTGWNDRLVEDYLEITQNLFILADGGDLSEEELAALTLIVTAHINNTLNPHSTTFTQAVAADPGTNITAAETETLSNGSNADSLHQHARIKDVAGVTLAETITDIFRVTTTSVIRFVVDAAGNLAASFYPQDTRNDGTVLDEKVLTTDNNGNVLLRRVLPYSASSFDATGGATDTNALSLYHTFNFVIPEDGDYLIESSWVWSYNSTNQDFLCQIDLDAGDILLDQVQEPKDSGGGGINLPNLDGGGTINTGTNQRYPAHHFSKRTLTAGAHTVTMSIGGSAGNNDAAIYQSAMKVTRDA